MDTVGPAFIKSALAFYPLIDKIDDECYGNLLICVCQVISQGAEGPGEEDGDESAEPVTDANFEEKVLNTIKKDCEDSNARDAPETIEKVLTAVKESKLPETAKAFCNELKTEECKKKKSVEEWMEMIMEVCGIVDSEEEAIAMFNTKMAE